MLGGWAVHLHVNEGFHQEYGREYIGSRDIDIGVHVDPVWDEDDFRDAAIGTMLSQIEDLGYTRSRFGFVQYFNRKTGTKLSGNEAAELPLYDVFELFVDIIPDTTELDTFNEVFGFRPPAEPLLQQVFTENRAAPLANSVPWEAPDDVLIADPAVLAVMKIRALPQRDKEQKRVKDLADLHALLWYVTDYTAMHSQIHDLAAADELETLSALTDDQLVTAAGTLLQVDPALIRGSIDRLT